MNEAEELFSVGDIGHASLAIRGRDFQPVTIRHGFIYPVLEALFRTRVDRLGMGAVGKESEMRRSEGIQASAS